MGFLLLLIQSNHMSDYDGISLFGLDLTWVGIIGIVLIAVGSILLLIFLGELRTAQYHGPEPTNAFIGIILLAMGLGMLRFGTVKPATT